ncbi:hypothetical protein NQ176_g7545 [Zarea fungicola]|uniref:Uncharacterized protein n=1 Tax=Zarea fungicola TaxID=93591 RepID=A0ACC1MZU0_9HYPO|nr:hypothetical protein NQ176_g7545 [Lecanicillium fungicola]
MKPSTLYRTLACVLLANLGQASPARPAPVELSDAVRAAYPGRLWAADYNGNVPDASTKWVLTNDFGTLPEYWIAEDDAATTELSPPDEKLSGRDLTAWAIAYSWLNCHEEDQIGWVNSPTSGMCYGLWSDSRGKGRSMWISGRTTQINAYVDAACAQISFVIRNYSGCKDNINIRSIWMRG